MALDGLPLYERPRGNSQERLDINQGRRRKPAIKTLARMEAEGDMQALAEGNVETVYDKPTPQRNYSIPLGDIGSQSLDYLAAGGWHVEKAGSTGGKVGRPVTGITESEKIKIAMQRISDVLQLAERQDPETFVTRDLLAAYLIGLGHVNNKALADLFERDDSTVRSYRRKGEKWLGDNNWLVKKGSPANSPKEGTMEATMATEIIERLDRIEQKLHTGAQVNSMRAETIDSMRLTLDELRDHFLGGDQAAIEDLLRFDV